MHGEKPKKAQPKKACEQKKVNAQPKKAKQGKKAKPQQQKFDHAAKAVEVRSAYKTSVEGMVNTGFILSNYQAELKDDREFNRFWRDHLGWAKSTVYRLVDVGKHFADLNGKTLAYFDVSALYLLAAASVKDALRKKAIKMAENGEFVTHKEVKRWLGKKPNKPTGHTIPPRPGTIRIDMTALTAEAKKVKVNAAKVLEVLERLGVTVEPVKEEANNGAKATAKPKKEVA